MSLLDTMEDLDMEELTELLLDGCGEFEEEAQWEEHLLARAVIEGCPCEAEAGVDMVGGSGVPVKNREKEGVDENEVRRLTEPVNEGVGLLFSDTLVEED